MIQNLLNTSGQEAAIRRAQQISNYVQRESGVQEFPEAAEFKTFEDVMKSSLNVHTRFNVNKPSNSLKFGTLTTKNVSAQRVDDYKIDEERELPYIPVSKTTEKSHIKDLISKISKKHGVDEKLVNAVIRQESGYNPKAKSSAGAQGLMQLMPSTAFEISRRYGLGMSSTEDLFNDSFNIKLGNYYYAYLKSMLEGRDVSSIAAYNGGIGSLWNWRQSINYNDTDEFVEQIPYSETQNYVKKVFRTYWNYVRLYTGNM